MIKPQCLYWCDFKPVRNGEFPNKHLAIVLDLNADKKTCRIVPLTRNASGVGQNKVNIGKLHDFTDDSYVVLDQVRTVAFTRLSEHSDGKVQTEIKIPNDIFYKIKIMLIEREEVNLNQADILKFYSNRIVELKKKQIINSLYGLKRKINELSYEPDTEQITKVFEQEIIEIRNELENKINHFVDIENYVGVEHPSLNELLQIINISIVEVVVETV